MFHKKRDPKKEALWRRQIRRQSRSGMTVRAWCLDRQVNEATFHWWRRKLSRRDGELKKSIATKRRNRRAATSPAFVPVRVSPDDPQADESQIEIALPDGRCVRVTGHVDRHALADVLEVLTLASSSEATIHAGPQSQWGARTC